MVYIDVIVRVEYERRKAEDMMRLSKTQLYERIRSDTTRLKLSHPPADNIREPKLNGISFFWTTNKRSPLFDSICRVVDSQDSDEVLIQAKKHCDVVKIHMSTLPNNNPPEPNTTRRPSLTYSPDWRADTRQHWRTNSPSPPRRRSVQDNNRRRSFSTDDKPAKRRRLSSTLQKMIEKTQSQFKLLLPDAVESTPPHPPSIPADTEQQSGTLADIPMLLREFWDNRRQLTAASARGNALEEELKSIGVPYYAWKMNQDLASRIVATEAELVKERSRRVEIEQILKQVEKECEAPTVVPEILNMCANMGKKIQV